MTHITPKDVQKISKLAHIKISEDKVDFVAKELTDILHWIETLSEVNIDSVEPQSSGVDISLRLREDKVSDGNYPEIIVKNAPLSDDCFFAVPKVIE